MISGDGLTQKHSIKHLYPLELTFTHDYPLSPEADNLNSIKSTVQPSPRSKRKVSSRKRKRPADDQYIYEDHSISFQTFFHMDTFIDSILIKL